MSKSLFVVVYLVIITILSNEAARILGWFPGPCISHQVVFRSLTHELVKRGHQVVVVTTHPAFEKGRTPENLTEIDVHDVSHKIFREVFLSKVAETDNLYEQMKVVVGITSMIFENQLQTTQLKTILQGENHFDLLLLESGARILLALSYLFKAPVIQVSSQGSTFGNYETIGAVLHPILYPTNKSQRLYNTTIWEDITNIYKEYALTNAYYSYESVENEMVKQSFGDHVNSLSELHNNIQMLFVNVHPIFEGNQPVPPGVIHVWGVHLQPEKELPRDLKSYLDSSINGVIYMSFGTNINLSTLPPKQIQIILGVLSQLSYNILLKWDTEELPIRSKNIRIGKWFQQSDLLRHPKIKLFITQGGLQSTDEAILAGVPLLGIPMFGDQWYNTEKFVYHKIGMKLDIGMLSEQEFKNAIELVIGDESYRHNIIKLRSLFIDQPQRPLERAVWWTEHVLRHGGGARHLRAPAANMAWAGYLEIELTLTLFISILTVISTSIYAFRCVVRKCINYFF